MHGWTEPSLTRLGRYGDSGPALPNIAFAVTSSAFAAVAVEMLIVSEGGGGGGDAVVSVVLVVSATAGGGGGTEDTFAGVPSLAISVLAPDRTSLCGRSTIGDSGVSYVCVCVVRLTGNCVIWCVYGGGGMGV